MNNQSSNTMVGAKDYQPKFKHGISVDIARRERHETAISIRKQKKDLQLAKRRQLRQNSSTVAVATPDDANNNQLSYEQRVHQAMQVLYQYKTTPLTVSKDVLLQAVKDLRKLLSLEQPPVDLIVHAGSLPYFAWLLTHQDSELQFEAAWSLTNVASTHRTKDVAQTPGVVEFTIRLLFARDVKVREQAGWLIGNIAGEGVLYRNELLVQPNLIRGMVENLHDPAGCKSLVVNFTWSISNLIRGKPVPDLALVHAFIQPLAQVLKKAALECEVEQQWTDAAWALSYIVDGSEDHIQAVLDTGVVPSIVQLIRQTKVKQSLIPLIRCLGNIVTGTDAQTSVVIDAGFLELALDLVDHSSKIIRKDVCWTLSNIAAGTVEQIGSLFLHHNALLDKVVKLANDAPWDIRKEAAWVLCYIYSDGMDHHIAALNSLDGIPALCSLLGVHNDTTLLLNVLKATEKLLERNELCGHGYDIKFDESGGLEAIEKLQEHASDEVYKQSCDLMERFFEGANETDENIAPVESDQSFAFGYPATKLFAENDPVSFSSGLNFVGTPGTSNAKNITGV